MKNFKILLFSFSIIALITACNESENNTQDQENITIKTVDYKGEMDLLLKKHLDAVTNRDLNTLASTMSPQGNMQLILPQTEIINGVDGFMDFHREWFSDSTWTFKTKILDSEAGSDFGYAITEILYEEPERDGKPYYNRMIVSYDLKRIDDKWYVVKDHASSIEKSTDKN